MEVARKASQKAPQASETAGRSAATAKAANTRTTALRDDVSHINKRLADHEAATRADREALQFVYRPWRRRTPPGATTPRQATPPPRSERPG